MPTTQPIEFRFDTHGLGDCVHAVTVLQLYLQRGFKVAIQVEPNKRWLWEAAGIPIYEGAHRLPLHPYYYPASFHDLHASDADASKIAHFIAGVGCDVLPRLGDPDAIWNAICDVNLDLTGSIRPETRAAARDFLSELPRPIFALHSRGTNWSREKSIPDGIAFETIKLLLEQTPGSVVTLDFDGRAPTISGHPRCRGILPGWPGIELEGICAFLSEIDLLIGIDSGPFHLAGLVGSCRSLGVFRQIPAVRCCIPNSRTTYLVPGRDHSHWKRRRESARQDERAPQWNFVEYFGDEPLAQEIVSTAIDLAFPPATPGALPPEGADEYLDALAGDWLYRRMGHDERRLELRAYGTIGHGEAGCERQWRAWQNGTTQSLLISGDNSRDTCLLKLGPDGVFRGRWIEHERMPIELIPINPVAHDTDLWNGIRRTISPADAVRLLDNYDPSWDLPVGTRGNGLAWLLDPKVLRSDLDVAAVDHEDWIYRYLETPAGSVCLDLASFIGTYAVWWATRGSRVIACEPLPRSRTLLHQNLQLNDCQHLVDVLPIALGTVPATKWMAAACHGSSSVGETGDVAVTVGTVDQDILPHLSQLDLIKLDVEGAECEVIAGAIQTLRRYHPRLIIEVHSHMPGREANGTILTRQLTELGYQMRRIWTNSPAYYYVEATYHE